MNWAVKRELKGRSLVLLKNDRASRFGVLLDWYHRKIVDEVFFLFFEDLTDIINEVERHICSALIEAGFGNVAMDILAQFVGRFPLCSLENAGLELIFNLGYRPCFFYSLGIHPGMAYYRDLIKNSKYRRYSNMTMQRNETDFDYSWPLVDCSFPPIYTELQDRNDVCDYEQKGKFSFGGILFFCTAARIPTKV